MYGTVASKMLFPLPATYRYMSSSGPLVSVIIPVYNDPRGIELTLESVTGQTYPADNYEIFAVDNNSSDDTQKIIQRYADRYEKVSFLLEDKIQSPAAARNRGIEHANGSILTFIDTDMTVDATWLTSLVETLEAGGHDYMGCAVETYPPEGRETIASKYDSLFAFPMEDYLQNSKFVGTGCLTVRKEVFNTIGVFDPHLFSAEDKEFGRRVYEAGFNQHFEPAITMYHPARSSSIEQLKKSFRIGRGRGQLRNRYSDRFELPSPFHFRDYLPLKPGWFHSRINRTNEFSTQKFVALYLLASTKKIVNSAGSLYEYLRDSASSLVH
ncbi:glycosyltransferase [Halococcus morrhuae DSM 1307]|uniref:glycosyltransferase n=1 Tax=Halococcus morrhuae TaxID=2250 RepID=UPI003F857CB8